MENVENPMDGLEKDIWLAAAEVEQRQFALDEATLTLRNTVLQALDAGADITTVAEAAGVTPSDLVSTVGSADPVLPAVAPEGASEGDDASLVS
ncbi:hypothetical protein KIH31_02825 [Paenarthrobacter sp. DKR-5]|uniref:hypothetical protein n=1 Tax=Paenarthrobacter sp. DKR-5 TaxID=2835535 RepID=UPI001BDD61E9|nr:hypothetical protein [Paenarthrobacter sp. DKR-5]MBT1001526.1 hypothetical protein [Paenarthrobacter sp. DKR-5]